MADVPPSAPAENDGTSTTADSPPADDAATTPPTTPPPAAPEVGPAAPAAPAADAATDQGDGGPAADGPPTDPFPMLALERLETKVNAASWTVPVKGGDNLEQCMRVTIHLCKQNLEKSSPGCERFMSRGMMVSFDKLFNSAATLNWGDDVHRLIQTQLEILVELIVIQIGKDCPYTLLLLEKLFDPTSNYNVRNEKQPCITDHVVVEDPEARPQPPRDFLFAAPVSAHVPHGWLIDLINLFGDHGGFDKILARLQQDNIDARILAALIRPFGACADLLTVECIQKYFIPIEGIGISFLKSLQGDKLKAETKNLAQNEALYYILRSFKGFRARLQPLAEAGKELDSFLLEMIRKLLTGDSFNGAMYALNAIRRLSAEVRAQWKKQNDWLTTDTLADWLVDTKFIEIVFKNHLHKAQYVAKLEEVVKFLMLEKRLTLDHLSLIWEAQVDKHEVIVNNIHDLLAKLAYNFDAEHLDHLFACFQRSWGGSPKNMEKLLEFVRRLAEDDSEGSMALKVLEVLWILAHESNVPQEIVSVALKSHVKILDFSYISDKEPEREKWMVACIGDLRKGTWTVPALQHLRSISELFISDTRRYPYTSPTKSRQEMLQDLEGKVHLKSLVVKSIVDYMAEARKVFAAGDGLQASETFVDDRYSHDTALNERLTFLKFLLWDGQLYLTGEEAMTLWDEIVAHPACRTFDERAGLIWFTQAMGEEADIEKEDLKMVFESKVLGLAPETIGDAAYFCFERFFQHVNAVEMKLRIGNHEGEFQVDDLDLSGLEHLWNIALQCKDSNIAIRAIELVKQVHTSLSPRLLKLGRKALHEQFIGGCMQRMSEPLFALTHNQAIQPAERTVLLRRVERCLALLEEYIVECSDAYPRERRFLPHGVSFRGADMSIEVSAPAGFPHGQRLDAHGHQEVRHIRQRIAEVLSLHLQQLQLFCHGRILSPENDRMVLRSLHFGLVNTIVVKLPENQAQPVMNLQPASEAAEGQLPGVIISHRPDFLQKLFQLTQLTEAEAIQERSSSLLAQIPSDPEVLQRLQASVLAGGETAQACLGAFLDPKLPPFQLRYNVEMLASLLQPAVEPEPGQGSSRAFHNAFVEQGGVRYLTNALDPGTAPETNALRLQHRRELSRVGLRLIRFLLWKGIELTPPPQPPPPPPTEAGGKGGGPSGQGAAATPIVDKRARRTELSRHILDRIGADDVGQVLMRLTWLAVRGELGNAEMLTALQAATGPLDLSPSGRDFGLDEIWLANESLHALNIVLCVQGEMRMRFVAQPCMPRFVADILLLAPSQEIRECARLRLMTLAGDLPTQEQLWRICLDLLAQLPRGLDTCDDFFEFLCWLANSAVPREGATDAMRALLDREVAFLKSYDVVDTSPCQATAAHNPELAGHTQFCQVLLKFFGSDVKRAVGRELIDDLINEFLFPASRLLASVTRLGLEQEITDVRPRSACRASRVAAFGLLTELAANCPENFRNIIELLTPLHFAQADDLTEFDYYPMLSARRPTGFVGLKNAGATCYMNSVLQQLYMQPEIRGALLSAAEKRKPGADTAELEETILFQLQCAFAHLQYSETQYYMPAGMWKTYRHYGQPVNVREQQDALEFFNNIVDQIDENLKREGQEPILSKMFGGMFADQKIIKSGCNHIYEREDPFTTLQVDIRNCQRLEESLEQYVKGDLLEGANAYQCEKCNAKRDTVKRACIKTLPTVLVIHLKRFDYDWERDMAVKFNDYFEFPTELDMSPYTVEGLRAKEAPEGQAVPPVDPAMFALVGVVVHSGQANGGHYYSFIRERSAAGHVQDERKWLRFDDVDVTESDLADGASMRKECFGGEYETDVWDNQFKRYVSRRRDRWWNGYMLFYERIDASNKTEVSEEAAAKEEAVVVKQAAAPASSTGAVAKVDGKESPSAQQQGIRRLVQEQNLRFRHACAVYNPDNFAFIRHLCNANHAFLDPQNKAPADSVKVVGTMSIALAVRFLTTYGFRTDKNIRGSLMEWPPVISHIINNCPEARVYLLQQLRTNPEWHKKYLLYCPNMEVRAVYHRILVNTLWQTFSEDGLETGMGLLTEILAQQIVPLFDEDLGKNWKHLQQVFRFLHDVAQWGAEVRQLLHHLNIFGRAVHFFLYDPSWNKYQQPDFTMLHAVVSTLVRATELPRDHPNDAAELSPSPFTEIGADPHTHCHAGPLLQLSVDMQDTLYGKQEYITETLNIAPASPHFRKMIQHVAYANGRFSGRILNLLLEKLDNSAACDMRPYLNLLMHVLAIEDHLQSTRIQYTCINNPNSTAILNLMEVHKSHHQRQTYMYIKFFFELMDANVLAKQYLMQPQVLPRWAWACKWLTYAVQRAPGGAHYVSPASNERTANGYLLERSESALDLVRLIADEIPPELMQPSGPAAAAGVVVGEAVAEEDEGDNEEDGDVEVAVEEIEDDEDAQSTDSPNDDGRIAPQLSSDSDSDDPPETDIKTG